MLNGGTLVFNKSKAYFGLRERGISIVWLDPSHYLLVKIFEKVRLAYHIPIVTDVHEALQASFCFLVVALFLLFYFYLDMSLHMAAAIFVDWVYTLIQSILDNNLA
ncbi:hypothetical protein CIPAW_03G171800 [Carya illinoinensis]|uniref:Uncharacterized protein n=1 Tax=Carya illinoinensis TaxID=32201 RepID=A0A8T1R4V0_CARIL|nr:hypothetical protein CIPAW_03G171800 [Carya illinoinensis]